MGIMLQRAVMLATASAAFGVLLAARPAVAQDEELDLGWYFTGDLSTVWAGGNSESFSLGVGSTLGHKWLRSELKFEGGSVFQQSSLTTRTAVGTSQEDFVLQEDKATEKTAEAYFLRGRYDYTISERFFVFGGSDWLRNRFSGIDSRLLFAAGVGNSWVDTERLRFKTDYSATYTLQEDVVTNPFIKSEFAGARLAYDFWWNLTSSTDFESRLISDLNLDNTDDIRLDFYNALPIAISSVLALKPAL
jgi:putative salt-induced outer membrane protein YdiY